MHKKGYDFFVTDPGVSKELYCRICKSRCEVDRNVYGPINWVSAVAGSYKHHDKFRCLNSDTEWHRQALEIYIAIESMPSKRVAELMISDLKDILMENGIKIDD